MADTSAGVRNPRVRNSRAGIPNYTPLEVTALLDIIEHVEPLGANFWALVAFRYLYGAGLTKERFVNKTA